MPTAAIASSTLEPGLAARIKDRQLLWIDLDGRDPADIDAVAAAVGIGDHLSRGSAGRLGGRI